MRFSVFVRPTLSPNGSFPFLAVLLRRPPSGNAASTLAENSDIFSPARIVGLQLSAFAGSFSFFIFFSPREGLSFVFISILFLFLSSSLPFPLRLALFHTVIQSLGQLLPPLESHQPRKSFRRIIFCVLISLPLLVITFSVYVGREDAIFIRAFGNAEGLGDDGGGRSTLRVCG